MTTEKYATASEGLLQKAKTYLAEGDLVQASEKGWGAAAQAIKAVAEARGWQHNVHRQLFEVLARLLDETGDTEIRRQFLIANALHTNFYENWLTRGDVEAGVQEVDALLSRLRPLM
ncbi:MAG: hypothetical protein E6J43_12580 [Chloroflexi bacterium]|nr:MAG: hypothetical protein E6J43_12580 [Chloroflexota bacterium]